jgi:hypothetical protein
MSELASIINAALCCGIAWACLCRSTKTSLSTTLPSVRYLYPVAGASALAAGFGWPWLGPWPHLALMGAYLFNLWLTSRAWADGVPGAARKDS